MYYNEGIINGVLCHKSIPDGEWIPFTAVQLTKRIMRAEKTFAELAEKSRELMGRINEIKAAL
jgi:hypothetical protein